MNIKHDQEIIYQDVIGIPEFLDSGRKSWTLYSERWTLHSALWMLEAGLFTLDSGPWTLDAGPWTFDEWWL